MSQCRRPAEQPRRTALSLCAESDRPYGVSSLLVLVQREGFQAPGLTALANHSAGALPWTLQCTSHPMVAIARPSYHQAIESPWNGDQALATYNLGILLADQGDLAGARAAYERAIDSGHTDAAPRAARNLGVLLADQGDPAGAGAAYERVIESGHADEAPWAARALGILLTKEGDAAGARVAYQRAIDSGHTDAAPTGGA